MNPPSFTRSIHVEDSKNFVEELKKVFEVMHVVDVNRVEMAAYELKGVARSWFDKWKDGELRMHHILVGLALKKPSCGGSFLAN